MMPGARGRRTWWRPFCVLVLVSLAGRGAFLIADDAPVDAAAVRQYNLAVGLQNKKLYAQAAQKWAAFIQGFPKDARLPNAHHYLGICQLQENKLPEAAASFRTVLKDFPNFAARDASQYNLGLVLYNTATASKKPEDWKEAIAAFAEVNAKFPESKHAPSALFYQGECAFSSGDSAGRWRCIRSLSALTHRAPSCPKCITPWARPSRVWDRMPRRSARSRRWFRNSLPIRRRTRASCASASRFPIRRSMRRPNSNSPPSWGLPISRWPTWR